MLIGWVQQVSFCMGPFFRDLNGNPNSYINKSMSLHMPNSTLGFFFIYFIFTLYGETAHGQGNLGAAIKICFHISLMQAALPSSRKVTNFKVAHLHTKLNLPIITLINSFWTMSHTCVSACGNPSIKRKHIYLNHVWLNKLLLPSSIYPKCKSSFLNHHWIRCQSTHSGTFYHHQLHACALLPIKGGGISKKIY